MNQPPSKLSRRTVFAGAGTIGAIAAAARFLPSARDSAPAPVARARVPEKGGGYSLSDHVKQYYQTTRI